MKTQTAYCSGCGHQVRLVFTDPPPRDGHANLRDEAEIVCLDYSEACPGGKCPTTGKPGVVMGVRLAKSHLNDDAFRTLHARCEACGAISDLEILDDTFAVCTLCNSTNRYVTLETADGEVITLTSL
jgi:hypothetical protein